MKLKIDVECVEIEDEIVLVPVGKSAGEVRGVFKCNREAKIIIDLLKDEITEKQIVDYLANNYENNRDNLTMYVDSFVSKLRSIDLLTT